jgi:hypothetical protein
MIVGGKILKAVPFLNSLAEPFTISEKVSKRSSVQKPCAAYEWQGAVRELPYF